MSINMKHASGGHLLNSHLERQEYCTNEQHYSAKQGMGQGSKPVNKATRKVIDRG